MPRATVRGVLLAVLFCSGLLPAAADAGLMTSPATTSVWELTGSAARASAYDLMVTWGVRRDAPGFAAVVAVRDAGGRAERAIWGVESDSLGGNDASARVLGQEVSCRASSLPCSQVDSSGSLKIMRVWGSDTPGQDAPSRILVVVRGVLPTLDADGTKGYRLRRISASVRAVTADSGSVSVSASTLAGAGGIEAFSAATAPGGSAGSIAIGVPPCSPDVVPVGGVRGGVGTVTLAGGTTSASLTCPNHDFRDVVAVARKKTLWSLTGPSAGFTEGGLRIVVIDRR